MARVLITEPVNEKGIDYLKEHGYEIIMGSGPSEETLMRETKGCDGVLTRNGKFTEKVLRECKDTLKVIAMHGVGVDGIDVDAATELGIQITNAAESNQSSVAEYTIGLILMLAKRSINYNNETKQGNMNEARKLYGSDVRGKRLGIIGMGNIGTQVAKIAHDGLGMDVIGYSRHVDGHKQERYCLLTSDMDEVFETADFVSLHLPGTASTYHLIGKRELSLMKETAFLINTGRGEVIAEEDLIQILKDKKIQGAALDVFEGNLPKSDNPLLSMENVIVTPHTAAFTTEALERMSYQAALGIVEVLEGRPVTYPVNRIHDTFVENKYISSIMNVYKYEFGIK